MTQSIQIRSIDPDLDQLIRDLGIISDTPRKIRVPNEPHDSAPINWGECGICGFKKERVFRTPLGARFVQMWTTRYGWCKWVADPVVWVCSVCREQIEKEG